MTERRTFSELLYVLLRQLLFTWLCLPEALQFIRSQKPWRDLFEHWWARFFVAVLAGFLLWDFLRMASTLTEGLLAAQGNLSGAMATIDLQRFQWVLGGAEKYLVLIVLELFTFHFIRSSLSQTLGLELKKDWTAFLHAEARMVMVSLWAWIMESIVIGILGLVFGMVGLGLLEEAVHWVVPWYFLGFTLLDNHLECLGYSVKESELLTRRVPGIAMATGIVALVLVKLPILGAVLATTMGAVMGSLAICKLAPVFPPSGFSKKGKQAVAAAEASEGARE